MAKSDHQLLIHSKPYLYTVAVTGLIVVLSLLQGDIALGFLALFLLLALNYYKSNDKKHIEEGFKWFKYTSLVLAVISLAGLMQGISYFQTWLYFVPLLLFFFYDFKQAIWLVSGFTVIAIFCLARLNNPFESAQSILNFILALSMSGTLVYLRELRRKQLKPLRRTDNLTTAATREHLDDDLTKEIQRSEREGSELSVLALAVDPICLAKLTPKEQDAITISLGKLLHNNLRLFDSYYLWDDHEFLIVLPHTSSVQAVKIADNLRLKVKDKIQAKAESVTVSTGVSGLNIGDDSHSLTLRAAKALKEASATSGNRTILYREKETTSPDTEPSEGGNI